MKTRTSLWWSSVEIIFIVFHRDISLIAEQYTWSLESDHSLTCSCYKDTPRGFVMCHTTFSMSWWYITLRPLLIIAFFHFYPQDGSMSLHFDKDLGHPMGHTSVTYHNFPCMPWWDTSIDGKSWWTYRQADMDRQITW